MYSLNGLEVQIKKVLIYRILARVLYLLFAKHKYYTIPK